MAYLRSKAEEKTKEWKIGEVEMDGMIDKLLSDTGNVEEGI